MSQLDDLLQSFGAQLAAGEVTATAGGGAVSVTLEGRERVTALEIAPEACEDPAMLAELVMAAINEALAQAAIKSHDAANNLLGQLTAGGLPGLEDSPPVA